MHALTYLPGRTSVSTRVQVRLLPVTWLVRLHLYPELIQVLPLAAGIPLWASVFTCVK